MNTIPIYLHLEDMHAFSCRQTPSGKIEAERLKTLKETPERGYFSGTKMDTKFIENWNIIPDPEKYDSGRKLARCIKILRKLFFIL